MSRHSTLYRSPKSGMGCHFYTVALEHTLFGEVTVTRSWGPLKGTPRTCQWVFSSQKLALAEFRRLIRIARRRGYATRIPRFKDRAAATFAPQPPDNRQLSFAV